MPPGRTPCKNGARPVWKGESGIPRTISVQFGKKESSNGQNERRKMKSVIAVNEVLALLEGELRGGTISNLRLSPIRRRFCPIWSPPLLGFRAI
jgi:hypothetical protein